MNNKNTQSILDKEQQALSQYSDVSISTNPGRGTNIDLCENA